MVVGLCHGGVNHNDLRRPSQSRALHRRPSPTKLATSASLTLQISHRPSPQDDGEAFALLHSPRENLGIKGADAGIHRQDELGFKLAYKPGIAMAVVTLSCKLS